MAQSEKASQNEQRARTSQVRILREMQNLRVLPSQYCPNEKLGASSRNGLGYISFGCYREYQTIYLRGHLLQPERHPLHPERLPVVPPAPPPRARQDHVMQPHPQVAHSSPIATYRNRTLNLLVVVRIRHRFICRSLVSIPNRLR